jgi:hypothetical protein
MSPHSVPTLTALAGLPTPFCFGGASGGFTFGVVVFFSAGDGLVNHDMGADRVAVMEPSRDESDSWFVVLVVF